MLKKKLTSAYRLLKNEGLKRTYDHSWLKVQVKARWHQEEVRFDGCRFNLDRVGNVAAKLELVIKKYEAAERRAVARYLRRDLPVVELGGSMGVVACVTNRLLKNPKAHVVVEANPLIIPQMELNKALNHSQFEIVNQAIAYGMDSVTFRPSSDSLGNSITVAGDQPPVTVQTVQLGKLVHDRGFGRFNLICDVEGLEFDLVSHEEDVLKNADTMILETHARLIGEEKCRSMLARLKDLGFRTVEEIDFVVVLRR